MRLVHAIAISSITVASTANGALASLLTSFTVTPSVIGVGGAATLDLTLTPVFDQIEDSFTLSDFTFESGDGQSVVIPTDGSLLAPLNLQYTFTYPTAGTFTPMATGTVSESFLDPSGSPIIADYFFFDENALTAELEVVPGIPGVPEPGTLALFGTGLIGWILYRRRKSACFRSEALRQMA